MESTAYPSNWFTHRNLVTDRRHYYLPPCTSVPQYFWRHVSVTLSQLQPSKPASFAPCKWSPRILWWVRPRVVLHHCSEFMRTDPVVEWIGLTTAQKLLWSNWHQPSCSYRIDGTRIWRPIATRPFTSCSVLPHVRSGQVSAAVAARHVRRWWSANETPGPLNGAPEILPFRVNHVIRPSDISWQSFHRFGSVRACGQVNERTSERCALLFGRYTTWMDM
jgi:hypothetical protein